MKPTTLLEFQRTHELLRRAEMNRERLSRDDYLDVIKSESMFRAELVADLKDHDMKQEPV